jgi:excisionase family DNA binding protein
LELDRNGTAGAIAGRLAPSVRVLLAREGAGLPVDPIVTGDGGAQFLSLPCQARRAGEDDRGGGSILAGDGGTRSPASAGIVTLGVGGRDLFQGEEMNEISQPEGRPRDDDRILITPKEAARRLCISERTLRYMVKAGELPAVPMGGRIVRYELRDVYALIDKRKSDAAERDARLTAEWQKQEQRRKTSDGSGGLALHSA